MNRWKSFLLFLPVLISLLDCAKAHAFQDDPGRNPAIRRTPLYHNIIALDMSVSVIKVLPYMKRFIADYAQRCIVTGEEVSLLIFSYDEKGSVKEVCSFVVSSGDSIAPLTRALDDLSVQNSRKTRTYFRPLAEYINVYLAKVRLQPVVLVLSDGQSDGFQDAALGKVDFREIPFDALGSRGIYQLPGVSDWKVAIQGGAGLDFKELFQKASAAPPVRINKKIVTPPPPLGPVIDPCRIDPELHVTAANAISFKPAFNPFEKDLSALVNITVRNDCVTRFRSFTLDINLAGGDFITLARVKHALIDQNPKTFSSPITLPKEKVRAGDAVLRVRLEQGNSVLPIYADPAKVELIPYWSLYWKQWSLAGAALLVPAALFPLFLMSRRRIRKARGVIITTLAGNAVRLTPQSAITIGGPGTALSIAGIPAGVQIGSIEWADSESMVKLKGENGFHLKVNGGNPAEEALYPLGLPLEFFNPATGASFDFALHRGNDRSLSDAVFRAPAISIDTWSPQAFSGFDLSQPKGPSASPLI